MSHKRNADPAATRPAGCTSPVAGAIFTLVLLAIGTALFLFGRKPIASEYFEYRFDFTIGSLGVDGPEGFRILEGPDAVFWGIAFCALGVMFGLWGVGVMIASLSGKKQSADLGPLGRKNAWLSFIVLLVALLCLFPPWRLGSLIFYVASVSVIGSLAISERFPKLPERVLFGLIVTAVLAGTYGFSFLTVGIIFAAIAMLFVGIHVLILAPQLMKPQRGRKRLAPSGSLDD